MALSFSFIILSNVSISIIQYFLVKTENGEEVAKSQSLDKSLQSPIFAIKLEVF